MDFHWVIRPLIGALIGYFTNYLAVKMLFLPRKEVRVFGHVLPFTPGIIPKGKPRLAKAAGEAVSTTLITGEDIQAKLLSTDSENAFAETMSFAVQKTIQSYLDRMVPVESEQMILKERTAALLTKEIMDTINGMQIGEIVTEKGGAMIRRKLEGSMLRMFVSDNMINNMLPGVGSEFERYISEHGYDYIQNAVSRKLEEVLQSTPGALLNKADVAPEVSRDFSVSLYRELTKSGVELVLKHLDIGRIVEEKINGMDNRELEALILKVMKKELNAIVNLGAVIGFLLGLINLAF